jgi:hypothetical protein
LKKFEFVCILECVCVCVCVCAHAQVHTAYKPLGIKHPNLKWKILNPCWAKVILITKKKDFYREQSKLWFLVWISLCRILVMNFTVQGSLNEHILTCPCSKQQPCAKRMHEKHTRARTHTHTHTHIHTKNTGFKHRNQI